MIFDIKRAGRGQLREEKTQLSPEMAKRLAEQPKTPTTTPRVPSSYGRFNETPLRVEVRPAPQVIDLEVQ